MNGQQRKFCEGYALEANGMKAYMDAYPDSSPGSAAPSASKLLKRPYIQAEIERIRTKAENMAGSAVMKLIEKRIWLARLVRADLFGDVDGDLCIRVRKTGSQGDPKGWVTRISVPDKIAAIRLDNDLAGHGSEAEENDALSALLLRVMK